MPRLSLLVDIDLCVGCYACEVACKQEHNLPVGPRWMRVVRVGPARVGDQLTMHFVPTHCMHCEKPPCIAACPMGAISKRADGIVIFSEALCIGCGECIEACPFGAPQYDPEKNVVGACNLCVQRIDEGKTPSCVSHCPTQALLFGDPNTLAAEIGNKQALYTIERDNIGAI